MKKLLSIILAFVMALGLAPVRAQDASVDAAEPQAELSRSADEFERAPIAERKPAEAPAENAVISPDAIYSGTCGDNLNWSLNTSTKVLTITGSGAMYDYSSDGAPWYSYRSYIQSVSLPSGLTSIGDSAFNFCESLTSITIGSGVTSIGDWAFGNCTSLTSITIGSGVTNIGDWAFCCTSLTSITIPNSVTSIGSFAFSGCTSLTSITIPSSVTSIGSCAFDSCTSLTSISVNSANSYYSSSNGVLFNKNKTTLICCPGGKSGAYTIPNSVTSIGYEAFYYCTSLTSITIPNSVTSIGNYAFSSCDALTSITIPNRVTSIGIRAFYKCSSLTSALFAGNPPTSFGGHVFDDCASGFTIIYMAQNASSWAPDGQTTWNGYPIAPYGDAYHGICGNDLFWSFDPGAGRLTITGTGDMYDYSNSSSVPWSSYKNDIVSVSFPSGMTSIGAYAFFSCGLLASASIPNGVTSIGKWAFYKCTSLVTVTIPNSVTSIDEYAFYECTALATVSIGSGVSSIGKAAFYRCDSLPSVTLPGSVADIGEAAFSRCASLMHITVNSSNAYFSSANGVLFNKNKTTLICCPGGKTEAYVIPESVTCIGSYAFYYCSALASATIPNSVASIEDWAFYGCFSFVSVNIPDSVTSIGLAAFKYCKELNSAFFEGNPPLSVGTGVFDNCASGFTIYYYPEYAYSWSPNGETTWQGYPIAPFGEITPTPTPEPTPAPTPTPSSHTVRFIDWNGAVLKTETVPHGGAATAPADPSRPGFTFVGWDKPFDNVTSDLDVNAVYQLVGVPGDVDGSGTLSVVDALFALRYAMGLIGLTSAQVARADFDGNGFVETADALLILRECLMALLP